MHRTIANKIHAYKLLENIKRFLFIVLEYYYFALTLVILRIISHVEGNGGNGDDITSPSRELTLSEVPYYAQTNEGQAEVREEFKKIKGGQRKSWDEALKPENIEKNRYDDLLAYDETRVKLKPSYEGQTSDYINANYINGINNEREYIATQGPLENTVNDFWAMVWQENANKIVILSNLTEKNQSKVFKYWPDQEDTYGRIKVTFVFEQPLPANHQLYRSFILEKDGVTRPVHQYHYTGWPDLGVPERAVEVLCLMREVRLGAPKTTGPIIVHCSAGVGRTGTVILMDSMIERGKKEGVVNFPERLNQMRLQRVDVVERPEQYQFAHEAVSIAFTPNTAQYTGNMDEQYQFKALTEYKELDGDEFENSDGIHEIHI